MLQINTLKEINQAARAANKFLKSIEAPVKHSQTLDMVARMCGKKNHMAHAAAVKANELAASGTNVKTELDGVRIFQLNEGPLSVAEMTALDWKFDFIVPVNPYRIGETDELNDEVSEILTGKKCALEDLSFEIVNHFYNKFHVAVRVTASVENPEWMFDLDGVDEPESGTTRTAKELAQRYGHTNEKSRTVLLEKPNDDASDGHDEMMDLAICGVGDDAFLEWVSEYGDPIGEVFNEVNEPEGGFQVDQLHKLLDEASAESSPKKLYAVEVQAKCIDGSLMQLRNGIGPWVGAAVSGEEAGRFAIADSWREGLDAIGAKPIARAAEVNRYMVCEGWGHIFVGKTETTTRWVVDVLERKLVCAQLQSNHQFVDMRMVFAQDLAQSLIDNDEVDGADFGDFEDALPEWATATFSITV
jgi:hypothetical protein